jgi:ATP-binding cassette subfamily B protein
MRVTRLEANYNPAIAFLPQLGLAAVLLIGGEAVIHAHLTLGQFTAFYLYLNMLISPMRSLGVTLNLAQRATASGARIFQLLDREPRLSDRPGAGGRLPETASSCGILRTSRPHDSASPPGREPAGPGRAVRDVDLTAAAGRLLRPMTLAKGPRGADLEVADPPRARCYST